MRLFATTLALLAVISAGCGTRPTGLLSNDLDSVSVTVAVDGPASIEGVPGRGLDLLEIALLSSTSGVRRLELHCSREDSASVADFLIEGAAGIPSMVRVSDTNRLIVDLEGISWSPRYSWASEAGGIRFEANVILHNSTSQTFRGVSMRIIDRDGLSLASTTGRIDLPPGDMVIPWWSASGVPLDPVLAYSWPVPAAWSAMVPVVTSGMGPVILPDGDSGSWPIVTGDTLWIPAPGLEVTGSSTQTPYGYETSTTVTNSSGEPVSVLLRYPEVLPSGASAGFDVDGPIPLGDDIGSSFTFAGTIRYSGRR